MSRKSSASVTLDGHQVALSSLDKVLFPRSGHTKGDLVGYYRRIADLALPLWRDRPLTMQRFPDGIAEDGFFQKDMPDHFPDWIDHIELAKEGGTVTHVVADDAATIVYLANQGCITPHLGLARTDRPHHPDRLIFDLDPSDDDFAKVRSAARGLLRLLDALELTSFVQTTGSRGLHMLVPLDRRSGFDEVRAFAREVAEVLGERQPDQVTVEQRKAKRGDRVFVDCLRNAYGQTAVAPYAVRAIDGAPVAAPLRRSELGHKGPGPRKYTIDTIFRRLARIEDPWAELQKQGHSLADARRRLDAEVRKR